ncbi:MAG: serine--tRNA ligase [Deltaproteobacteria bacterium]|nr:serine--tRNA ligase [Deltaproteobacteria bacterium]
MIDLHDLRKHPERYQEGCDRKRIKFSVSEFLQLDERYRSVKAEVESLRSKQNAFSKELPKLMGKAKEDGLDQMKQLSARLKEFASSLKDIEEEWQRQQLLIPSIPRSDVPDGASDKDNVEMYRRGEPPVFDFETKDHVELGSSLGIIDIERGVKVSGSRNYFLKGDGVRLQHAVLSMAMDLLSGSKGYTLMDPPHIVKYQAMSGTGYFPGGEEQAYHLDQRDDDLFLIGTAEVPVCAYHADEILDASLLPLRYAGYSPCYRREAGTYGKDTHGIYRIHQFYKVEQVVICKADEAESAKLHAELLANAEEMVRLLELPYRVVAVSSGDMGQGQVYKNDIEVWMPSRKSYCETHSCSSFHDFQARRLGMRYKDDSGKNIYCYTLNNTCIASPRILIPLLEVHQQRDGSVTIPEALRKYMGAQDTIKPK